MKATAEQIKKTPIGDVVHKNGVCCKHEPDMKRLANDHDVQAATTVNVRGHQAWERALVPRPPVPKRKKAKEESFTLQVKPKAFPVNGIVYSDGSARDGRRKSSSGAGGPS